MIKGWDLTIYELLGYLVPGAVAFVGLVLVAGSYQPALLDVAKWSSLGWWAALPLVASYILGHMLQSLANLLFGRRWEDSALASVLAELPAQSFEAIARRLSLPAPTATDIEATKTKPRPFLAMCNEILDQGGKTASRDVYLYREGFYRGTSIALGLLAVGVAAVSVQVAKAGARALPVALAVVSAAAAVAFIARYTRFVRYRISSCIWGAVTISTPSPPPAPEPATKDVD